jgi:hypothetical protein
MPLQGNDALWNALQDASKNRARVYFEFFRAVEGRYGRAAAVDICKEAIRNWGRGQAGELKAQLTSDFLGLSRSFFCEMASQADYGALEAAGFWVTIETWKPGCKGCCSLKIRRIAPNLV